ncbi:hypothetical protein [Thalassotalea hakodatensis]|uniref:hypothetical protein n=1 Tax=Thalassotalea hakodatensis TaxID=3030492 RepID=UPI0025722681|nr:hypothetical protein [Thalassotalea hakodatensis]
MELEKEDLIVLNRTGENLKSVLRRLIAEFPRSAQSITGMSKWLSFNRSNCQRILDGVYKSRDGKQVLCLLPGIAGLKDFLTQVEQTDIEQQLILETVKALDTFELVLKKYVRSHAELKRLLGAKSEFTPVDSTMLSAEEKREQHYLASKQLVGSSIDTLFACYLLKENEHNNEFLQEVAMIAKQGIVRAKSAPPFVQFYTHPHPEDFTRPENITRHSSLDTTRFQVGVVDEYSTKGLLDSYASYSVSNSGIVFNEIPNVSKINATFLFSNPDELSNPLQHVSKCSSTSISIKNPTRKLLTMVFFEKKLDRRSTVNVGCYSGNQKVKEGKLRADDMWTERLPEFPELRIVQPDAPNFIELGGLAIKDMTDYLFNFTHLNKNDFICYFLEVDHPIWSSTYRIYFEHE